MISQLTKIRSHSYMYAIYIQINYIHIYICMGRNDKFVPGLQQIFHVQII